MTGVYVTLCILIVLPLLVILFKRNKSTHPKHHLASSASALTGVLSAQVTKDTLKQYTKHKQQPLAVFLISIDRYQGLRANFPNSMIEKIEKKVFNRIELILDKKKLKGVVGLLESNGYCLIVSDINGQDAETLSANMCQAVNEQKFTAEGRSVSISLSIGTVHSNRNHPTPFEIISEANFLLQEAQSRGRSYFEYADMSG